MIEALLRYNRVNQYSLLVLNLFTCDYVKPYY